MVLERTEESFGGNQNYSILLYQQNAFLLFHVKQKKEHVTLKDTKGLEDEQLTTVG